MLNDCLKKRWRDTQAKEEKVKENEVYDWKMT